MLLPNGLGWSVMKERTKIVFPSGAPNWKGGCRRGLKARCSATVRPGTKSVNSDIGTGSTATAWCRHGASATARFCIMRAWSGHPSTMPNGPLAMRSTQPSARRPRQAAQCRIRTRSIPRTSACFRCPGSFGRFGKEVRRGGSIPTAWTRWACRHSVPKPAALRSRPIRGWTRMELSGISDMPVSLKCWCFGN